LDSDIHLGFGWVRDSISAKLNFRTEKTVVSTDIHKCGNGCQTHFFIMTYLRAFPKVWPSSRNSNEAAVSVDPGSCEIILD